MVWIKTIEEKVEKKAMVQLLGTAMKTITAPDYSMTAVQQYKD